jgi:hypothetical protein
MKTKLVIFASIIIATLSAYCQTNSNGLAVIAINASLAVDTNAPKLWLMAGLLNTTNHDIVVLTKGLDGSFNQSDTNKWECAIGYDDNQKITCEGHTVVPSFYDFAPVTIRPNEVAVVSQDFDLETFHLTTNAQLTLYYSISTNWASRFGTWSGSVASQPFKASAQ